MNCTRLPRKLCDTERILIRERLKGYSVIGHSSQGKLWTRPCPTKDAAEALAQQFVSFITRQYGTPVEIQQWQPRLPSDYEHISELTIERKVYEKSDEKKFLDKEDEAIMGVGAYAYAYFLRGITRENFTVYREQFDSSDSCQEQLEDLVIALQRRGIKPRIANTICERKPDNVRIIAYNYDYRVPRVRSRYRNVPNPPTDVNDEPIR